MAEELIHAIGLEPAYVGGTGATGTVNGVSALWLSLVKQHDGERRVALQLLS